MTPFAPENRHRTDEHREIYTRYQIAFTLVDFLAAASFVVGSVMFFYQSWQTAGTWLFLVGSILFAGKPTIRLARELAYLRVERARRGGGG